MVLNSARAAGLLSPTVAEVGLWTGPFVAVLLELTLRHMNLSWRKRRTLGRCTGAQRQDGGCKEKGE